MAPIKAETHEVSEETVERAKKHNKPIFVYVYLENCSPCMAMEESFSDPGVANILNDEFVSMKIDLNEKPNIGSIFANDGFVPAFAYILPGGEYAHGEYGYKSPSELKNRLESFLELSHRIQEYVR